VRVWSSAGPVFSHCTESSSHCATQMMALDLGVLGIDCALKGARALVD
jgi:hypothetical protein